MQEKKPQDTIPNIPIDKLRAVSKTMAEAIENKSGYDAVVLSKEEWEAIAADLLRLAEEKARLKAELGFKYGKQCQCGYTVWVIPDECKDGSL